MSAIQSIAPLYRDGAVQFGTVRYAQSALLRRVLEI
jgi:hypothetical protein